MAKLKDVIAVTLSALTGIGGSFTASYPDGHTAEDYLGAIDHELHATGYPSLFAKAGDFAVAFGASNIAVTILRGNTFTNGAKVFLHLDRAQRDIAAGEKVDLADDNKMSILQLIKINLGAPAAAVANGIVASQAATAASGLATGINGSLAASGKVVLPRSRNVVAAWTGTSVITVTGKDEYGKTIRESSASGTSFTGKKAFKEITAISVSADVTGLTVGTGVVLGLPVYLPDTADVVREIANSVPATAGTIVAGDLTAATATTGDVRGTYAPNSAPNGTNVYELVAMLRDPSYKGPAQFAG